MSSNSPSGGMKLMLLSESNLLSLTHWWKVQSSMAIDCLPLKKQDSETSTSCSPGILVQSKSAQAETTLQSALPTAGVQEMGRRGDLADSSLLAQTFLVSLPQTSYFRNLV